MFYKRFGKLIAIVQDKREEFDKISHPTYNSDTKNDTMFFYHKTIGSIIFQSKLVDFLTDKLRLQYKPDEFEFYYTAFHTTSYFAEVVDKLDIMPLIKIDSSYVSKLNRKQTEGLKQEYYFTLLSLLQKWGRTAEIEFLTKNFFIHYLFTITFPTPIKKSIKDWCHAIITSRYGSISVLKDSVYNDDGKITIKLTLKGDEMVVVEGVSIKTSKNKAYNELLRKLLE